LERVLPAGQHPLSLIGSASGADCRSRCVGSGGIARNLVRFATELSPNFGGRLWWPVRRREVGGADGRLGWGKLTFDPGRDEVTTKERVLATVMAVRDGRQFFGRLDQFEKGTHRRDAVVLGRQTLESDRAGDASCKGAFPMGLVVGARCLQGLGREVVEMPAACFLDSCSGNRAAFGNFQRVGSSMIGGRTQARLWALVSGHPNLLFKRELASGAGSSAAWLKHVARLVHPARCSGGVFRQGTSPAAFQKNPECAIGVLKRGRGATSSRRRFRSDQQIAAKSDGALEGTPSVKPNSSLRAFRRRADQHQDALFFVSRGGLEDGGHQPRGRT